MYTFENEMSPMEENGNLQGQLYLKPGELYSGCRPVRVTTVVGSCVAVTMYHRKRNVAAMCHAMQPTCLKKSPCCRDTCCKKFKIVRCVITEMIYRLRQLGAPKEGLEAKLFGGSVQFATSGEGREDRAVGRQNIDAALDVFSAHGVHLSVAEVGGSMGRKLIFDTNSGVVFLKRIGPISTENPQTILPRENLALATL